MTHFMSSIDGLTSIVCLTIVLAICVSGVFSSYNDNVGQRIGMSVVAVWCLLRLPGKIENMDTEPVHLVLHVGMAFYAVGAWMRQRRLRKMVENICDECDETKVKAFLNMPRRAWFGESEAQ